MSAAQNLRDLIAKIVPSWLGDDYPDSPSYGYRFLWSLSLLVDASLEAVLQGSLAAVGHGTPTAFDWVGQARGLVRNQDESETDYGLRLATWIDRAKENGSSFRLALAIHDYLRSHPRIRVFNRNGICLTVDTDRTVTVADEPDFDWDSVTNPDRSVFWSDEWIVVYTTSGSSEQWPIRPGTLGDLPGEDGFGLGHLCTHKEIDDIKGLIQLCKSCHTCVRAVIWTSNDALFVPGNAGSMPDGTWGEWSVNDAGVQVPSGRVRTDCRYWEPR